MDEPHASPSYPQGAMSVIVFQTGRICKEYAGTRPKADRTELYWNMGDEAVRRRVLTGFQ